MAKRSRTWTNNKLQRYIKEEREVVKAKIIFRGLKFRIFPLKEEQQEF
ncbi:hypothetical protein [Clostridium septicum]|nr:hypothetical protein [Clostridium septicum]